MTRILLKHGRVLDPVQKRDSTLDILIENGRILGIAPSISVESAKTLDLEGCIVAPGFIDIHTHLREPGQEEKETIETATRAAAAGGFTAVCAMPNTEPVHDNSTVTRWILDKALQTASVRVWPIASVSIGLKSEQLTEMADLRRAGAVAFSDDGMPVRNDFLMRCALEYVKMLDCPVINHCEVFDLSKPGVVHEGRVSAILGLKGIPAQAETVMAARDILLAQLTHSHVHLTHISTRETVQLLEFAQNNGIHVTADVTPHHIALTEDALLDQPFDTSLKVNPPLRSEEDREALIEGIKNGFIQAIGTDHAPHHLDDKRVEFDLAAFGIAGLETAVALTIKTLVLPGHIDWMKLVELFTTGPAQILHTSPPTLKEGELAHITVIHPDVLWTFDVNASFSKGKNTPFHGWQFQGKPVLTIVNGEIVHLDSQALIRQEAQTT